ncbi:GyrI-like domain-containing protein [Massilia sp. YMA4]|uniref:AraC family transcriptional regulator n=1 Tax=Massilia sp. YMA4 TaxID=1593482 RepID=UPI000DD0F29A|nr:AraC family transcriptional regulator [Massilia sp. YMA4]AXA89792.1 AraC family transcriptional regulator [Massilia sp. YMA4]
MNILNRHEYDRRMHRVLDHIDRHLDRQLSVAELAEVAHFSAFHFHRMFTAWMGETVADHVRRRRLETAASRLASQPGVTVLQAALAAGFGSAEAFTRAFKLHFGLAPTAWRQAQQESKIGQVHSKIGQAGMPAAGHDDASTNHGEYSMIEVSIVERNPVHVAYLRKTGPYGPELGRFWGEVVYPWMATNNLLGLPRYGICLDDPTVTAPEQCRYDAAVEVPPERLLSGNPMRTVVPGGQYAVHRFRGPVEQVAGAWLALTRDWLPASGLQLDARPFVEHYPPDAAYDPATGVFEAELCMPVTRL